MWCAGGEGRQGGDGGWWGDGGVMSGYGGVKWGIVEQIGALLSEVGAGWWWCWGGEVMLLSEIRQGNAHGAGFLSGCWEAVSTK